METRETMVTADDAVNATESAAPRIMFRFDERKAAAAAGVLLEKVGGRMPYLRLIKLLYFADRMSLDRYRRPITGDRYVSMRFGPVLSTVLNLIKTEPFEGESGPWLRTVERCQYDVCLRGSFDKVSLSEAEIEILEQVSSLFVDLDLWKLASLTHALPEWRDPGDSALPITPESILAALAKSDAEIEDVRQVANEDLYFDRLLGFGHV